MAPEVGTGSKIIPLQPVGTSSDGIPELFRVKIEATPFMALVQGPCLSVKAEPRAMSMPHASANVKMRALHEGGHEVFEILSVLSRYPDVRRLLDPLPPSSISARARSAQILRSAKEAKIRDVDRSWSELLLYEHPDLRDPEYRQAAIRTVSILKATSTGEGAAEALEGPCSVATGSEIVPGYQCLTLHQCDMDRHKL
ncbi:hypothetical protein B0H13DRAFT_1913422 [Mycena leptocephala]|nr:hypothetical protein B0H13DRAFT_1913422 [Mycena leptocephala]